MSTVHAGSARPIHVGEASFARRVRAATVICGIVGAQQVQFAQIADHVPIRGRKTESLIGRFRRWVKHETITVDDY